MHAEGYEKREEPVTFRTSGRKAAWLNDVARVRRIDRSLLCDEVMTDFLENQERVRTPEYRTRELEESLNAARSALDAACKRIGMIRAGREGKRGVA
jgi:hypothetical protein